MFCNFQIINAIQQEDCNKDNGKSSHKKCQPGRKQNFCIICKKQVKEFCRHFERMHYDTPEGQRLIDLNKISDKKLKKELKTKITNELRNKGNAAFCEGELGRTIEGPVITVKRYTKITPNHDNTVQCIHCKGFYKKRSFSRHLKRCLKEESRSSLSNFTKVHSEPVLQHVEGASDLLIKDIIRIMKKSNARDNAISDSSIMKYALEVHKTRRADFQVHYISRIITDLSKVVLRMKEHEGDAIKCLEDVFNPLYFKTLVQCILEEGGYDSENGEVRVCGLSNRLRSHIKGAAETAMTSAAAEKYSETNMMAGLKRKRIKHFLEIFENKWANEVGRIFDQAVKKSRSENDKKLAAEEDIVKTCSYVTSNYKRAIKNLVTHPPNSDEKQSAYNYLMDLLVTHIMCLIRRRPVVFKRAKNVHYSKMQLQEDLISEIKNSKHMNITEEDLKVCKRFNIFYVPGKAWKEMVPIALTNIMKEAMDTIQDNKKHVNVTVDRLFVRAKDAAINPRECIKKVIKNIKLRKPEHMSGNGLRHHAGTFSKLHSSHPQYQDYLASALGHTLHIHKLHYEMPTSIIQKLIVCPVLENMTKPLCERDEDHNSCEKARAEMDEQFEDVLLPLSESTEDCTVDNRNESLGSSTDSSLSSTPSDILNKKKRKASTRTPWTNDEKTLIYKNFGTSILQQNNPPRSKIVSFYYENKDALKGRSIESLITFINNKTRRKQKNVTPDVKKFMTYRKLTNVPI